MLTATLLEHSIANNADLWGLLQPYAHLNAGRTATGNPHPSFGITLTQFRNYSCISFAMDFFANFKFMHLLIYLSAISSE